MYSRQSVGPGMEPSGSQALTGYCCEDLPSTTTRFAIHNQPPITEKRRNKAKY